MSDLVARLEVMAGMIEMCEGIAWGSDSAIMREAIAELEALRAENERLREPVTVKPLAWEDFSERSSKATAMLLTSYMVQRWSCGRFDLSISAPGYSTGLEGAGGFYDTMDAAKAAAQADYESRIRAAINERKET